MNNSALKKSILTTTVGAIARFEKYFGRLWGQDKPDEVELTENEEKWLKVWQTCRTEIFDFGNDQKRRICDGEN